MAEAMERVVIKGEPDPRELAQLAENTPEFQSSDQLQRMFDASQATRDSERSSLVKATLDTALKAQKDRETKGGSPFIEEAQADLTAYRNAVQREEAAREEAAKKMQPEYQKALQQLEAQRAIEPKRPEVPVLAAPPKREAMIDHTAAKTLFAVASFIGALGMAGGRGRGMLAAASLTGAIKGYNEGNTIKYNAAKDEYQNQIAAQVQQYNLMHTDYMDQISAKRRNLEDLFAELELKGKIYNDPVIQAAAQAKDLDAIFKHTAEVGKLQYEIMKAAGKPIGSMPLERQKWEVAAKGLGYNTFDEAPPAVQNQIMEKIAGLRAAAYEQSREKYRQYMMSTGPVDPKTVLNWMDQNGRTPDNDPRFAEPLSRSPRNLSNAGYILFGDTQVARAYRQSFQALTQLKRIDNDVERLYKGVDYGTNIANALALKVRRGMGEPDALQLRRTILETLPTMALAEGMTAGRVGEAILGEFELPQFPTDRDTYASAKRAIQTLQQRLANNIRVFRGVGIAPSLVQHAEKLAVEGQEPGGAAQGKPKILSIEKMP
jgi:hypothetical protein